jgi:hypothetical protein
MSIVESYFEKGFVLGCFYTHRCLDWECLVPSATKMSCGVLVLPPAPNKHPGFDWRFVTNFGS